MYGIGEIRELDSDDDVGAALTGLFSHIAPHAVFSAGSGSGASQQTISHGDSVMFWQHSSLSVSGNEMQRSSGTGIGVLVNTTFDSSKVVRMDSPFLTDSVRFEHIDYFNDNIYYYPENFRHSELVSEYILDKQPDPSELFTSELVDGLWITMPVVLDHQEAKHLDHAAEIEALSRRIEELYLDESALFQDDDVWYSDLHLRVERYPPPIPLQKESRTHVRLQFLRSVGCGARADRRRSRQERRISESGQGLRLPVPRWARCSVQASDTRGDALNFWGASRVRSWAPFLRILSQGKMYVLKSFDGAIENGDEVLEINGVSVSELVDRAVSRGVGSTQGNLLGAAVNTGYFVDTPEVTVKLLRGDDALTVQVNTIPRPAEDYFRYLNNPFGYDPIEYPAPNTVYINPSLLSSEDLYEAMEDVLRSEHLIVDLRDYPNSMRAIFEHLPVEGGLGRGLISSYPVHMHPNQEWSYHMWRARLTVPSRPFIDADISVLIGSSIPTGTRSRGETFASYLSYAGATLIGDSNTKGSSGGLDWFVTPGRIRVNLTSSYTVRQNGEEMQSVGIEPDILVRQTVEDLREGRDVVFEAALSRPR